MSRNFEFKTVNIKAFQVYLFACPVGWSVSCAERHLKEKYNTVWGRIMINGRYLEKAKVIEEGMENLEYVGERKADVSSFQPVLSSHTNIHSRISPVNTFPIVYSPSVVPSVDILNSLDRVIKFMLPCCIPSIQDSQF